MTSISDTEVVNAPGGLVELAYSQITAPVNITSTTFASPNNVISDITVVCDGSPIIVEIYSPYLQTSPQTQYSIIPILRYDGNLYKLGIFTADANLYAYSMQFMQVRLTPSAGVHTFGVAASTESAQTAVWGAGSGASGGAHTPSYIRISKVIQASQLLVTQSNAPIVTSLPSGNLVTGQEVDLYVTTPYVGYQRYKWNGSAWYMIADSRSTGAWQTWSPTITQGVNVTHNVARARYIINGKTVQMMMGSTITGTGTSGNAINISLPVTAFSGAGYMSGRTGTFHYYRSATGFRYTGILELNTTTTGVMVSEETGGNALGAAPSFSAGVNDQIAVTATYEVD